MGSRPNVLPYRVMKTLKMKSKKPAKEDEEQAPKAKVAKKFSYSDVGPMSDTREGERDLGEVQNAPSTSAPCTAEKSDTDKTETAKTLNVSDTNSEDNEMEAMELSGDSRQTTKSDTVTTPVPKSKSDSPMSQGTGQEVISESVEIEVMDSKGDNPEITVDVVNSVEEDDSDSQWTDISDVVTEDEDNGETDHTFRKHESAGTSGKYGFSSTPVKETDSANSSSLSEEEKKNYAFISEQLSILNEESSTVNTALHKPQKKQSRKVTPSKYKIDPKKTPRKQTASSSSEIEHRKSVRKRLETTPTSTPRKHNVDVDFDAGSADDADTSQDALQIDEQDIDETLDRKARKKGLTAVNVKNIIHELVKNVDVQNMLRSHMNEQLFAASGSEGLPFEPKMTRAKVKEVIEKGVPLQTWPLSPVKKTTAPKKPSILDIDFPDDEEDDEYSPDKDAEVHHESDDDLESMMSSHASDLGSPLPPTPSTPNIQTPFRAGTPQTGDTETFLSPMSTTSSMCSRHPSLLGQHYKSSMAALDDCSTQGSVAPSDTIAKRTRSKLPLTDTSLTAIEEAFVAPDITPDMYDTECDDSEWQEFLRSLVKSDADPGDDDVNDPEFDFLEEAEKLEETEEDFRFDRPFRVSKKELNQLITELDELFPEPEEDDKTLEIEDTIFQESPVEKKQKKTSASSLNKSELEEHSLIVSAEERLLIEDQMRKHVQLTTQLFFLCMGNEDFEPMTVTCRQLLRELDIFRCVSVARDKSSYNVCNLQEAMDLVGEDRTWNLSQEAEDAFSYEETNSNTTDSDKESLDGNKKLKKNRASSHPLLPSQVEVFWNSPVFLYPQLLPRQRLLTLEEVSKCRLIFTTGEDNLIALGFEQFHHLKNYRTIMQKYLLPAKTSKQINLRMKNLKSKRTPDNALKFFIKNKKALPRALVVEAFYPDQIKAPKDHDDSVLPPWAKRKRVKEKKAVKKGRRKKQSIRKRSSSLSLPLTNESVTEQWLEEEAFGSVKKMKKMPRSAPVSPTEDSDSRRSVEDTYPLLSKIPASRTIITPEGVFIPFKVLSSASTSDAVSTSPQPSTSTIEPSQCLPSGLLESLGSLRGSIRIIPGTRPGEQPRIVSSLIAVQGKPVQLSCIQTQEDLNETSESLERENETKCQTEREAVERKDDSMETEPVSNPGTEDDVVGVQNDPSETSDLTEEHKEIVDESVSDGKHGEDLETNVDDCDNQASSRLQTYDNPPEEASSGNARMNHQIDSTMAEELHITEDTKEILSKTLSPTTDENETASSEVQKTEAVQEAPSRVLSSPCTEEHGNDQIGSSVCVQSSDTQEPEVENTQLETDRATNQIMSVLEPELCSTSSDVSETSVKACVSEEKPCEPETCCETEANSGSSLVDGGSEDPMVEAGDASETFVKEEHLQADDTSVSKSSSTVDNVDGKHEDPPLHTNQSATPETLNERVDATERIDSAASIPSSSPGSSEQVIEIAADTGVCDPKEDQTNSNGVVLQTEAHGGVLDSDQTVGNNNVIMDSPSVSIDSLKSENEHVCVYPSTPPKGNAVEETDSKEAANTSSPEDKKQSDSPLVTRTPLEIIAAFCSYYGSPASSHKSPTYQQSLLEKTPPKKQSETVYRELRPKPPCGLSGADGSSPKPVSPFLAKVTSKSPKRVLGGNRTILPKAFVLDTKESPTKRAARSLRKRAQMICQRTSPCKLLPQTELQRIQRLQLCPLNKVTKANQSRRKQATPVRKVLMRPGYTRSNSESDDLSETEDGMSKRLGNSPRVRAGRKRKLSDTDRKQEESDGGQSEVEEAGMSQEDSQNEDDVEDTQNSDQNHLDMLMAASTTLGFGQKKSTGRERVKGKTHKKKEQTLAMLAPDLLEMDPKKDEKDTAFAQAYLDRVRESLKENLDVFEEFLALMYNVGKDGQSPIELYQRLEKIFKDFPELLDDFAGFLLPEQAVACGCIMKNQETVKARTFLRKLEVNYEKQPYHFQKILKVLTQWYQNPQRSSKDLQNSLKPLLRGMPHLLEEFTLFFPEEKPPESYMNDFENVTLSDSDFDEGASVDSFEEADFPDELDTYRTEWCTCDCHQDPNEVKQFKRLKHCFNCSLKVLDGKLYFQPSRNKLYPAKVIVHKPVSPTSGSKSVSAAEIEDDQTADKENLNCLGGRPTVISPSVSHSSPVRSKRIKLKISRKKAGQKRFLTLCEIGGSPTKQEPVTDQDTTDEPSGATEESGPSIATAGSRLSPHTSRRDSDALIVNPPVTLQADILQNEKCDSDTPVSTGESPVMLTSFASLSFPTTSTSAATVCSDVQASVPEDPVTAPSIVQPVCSVSATKPVAQNSGFVKISPAKGPLSPLVTQLSFGAGKSPSVSQASQPVETANVGGTRILGGGATLTIGSNISALSGSSVTLTKQMKTSTSAQSASANPILGSVSVQPIQTDNVTSRERLSFPNLVPADAICHNDAITLNSGQQPSTQPTTSTTTLSFGSAPTADHSGQPTDHGQMPGSGLGMSLLNILDGASMQGDTSQSCMSDILAKAMKSADINMSDAEISMSMDFMNSFLAANFKHPGSRNASPVKIPSTGVADLTGLQQVPNLTISLQEHLMKAGILNKSETTVSSHTQNNPEGASQCEINTYSAGAQEPSQSGSVPVTMAQLQCTEGTDTLPQTQSQHSVVNVSSSVAYTTVGLTNIVSSPLTISSQMSAVTAQSYVLQASDEQVYMQAVSTSAGQFTGSTDQVYVQGEVSSGQTIRNTDTLGVQATTSAGQNVSSTDPELGHFTTGNVAGTPPGEIMEAAPMAGEPMEVEDDTEVEWTKDMDKLCLEVCKKSGTTEETFSQIAEKLKVVTPNEVAARFEKLMQLLSNYDEREDDSECCPN